MPADSSSDAELVATVGDVVQRPRVEPADSFVLHAPLELAARSALLPWVARPARDEARDRLRALATAYARAGDPLAAPRLRTFASPEDATVRLVAAIDAGDLDEVDATAAWIGRAVAPTQLRSLLAAELAPRLAAAAHAPIFLYLLPRVSPRGELTAELLRPLARELARAPEWRLSWHEGLTRGGRAGASALWESIAATPQLGVPGSDFIHPLMSQAERTGVAAELLRGVVGSLDLAGGARVLLRAAARSMLDEPDDYAPYGWSHCLTMPQGVLGSAGTSGHPVLALAVAATFVVGFRAALASRPLGDDVPVDPPEESVTEIVTFAAIHEDAHLVKYTLACLDAAAWDRQRAGLYLSAAARLGRYWRERVTDPAAA
ncbi:MAG TPA: hypothetical protein VIH82_00690 [Acidimicrobiia bacterium]|jgi:hypothetical protein